MPPTNKASHSPAKSNVHRLFKVEPREGWTLDGPFGHMAFEAGDDGRLERLAEVVKWLQSSKKIPRSEAVKLLFEAMQPEVMEWLYWLQPTKFATPVPATETFGYLTIEQIGARKSKDRQNALQRGLEQERSRGRFGAPLVIQSGRISFGYPEPTAPGLPALLKYLGGWWALPKRKRDSTCDMLDDITVPQATLLAIRLDKAHELWGYGRSSHIVNDRELLHAEPPTSWSAQSPLGLLRRGPAPADRLVRLADVVRWFIAEQEKPRLGAVQRVCSVINADSMHWLYSVTQGNFAQPINLASPFGKFLIGNGTNAEKLAQRFVSEIESLWGNPLNSNNVIEVSEYPCAALACTIDRAYALWGYGRPAIETTTVDVTSAEPTTWAELVSFRRRHTGTVWSVAQKRLIDREKSRRDATPGAQGIAKAMAKELGISVTLLNGLIRAAHETGKRAGRNIKTT